MSRDRPSQTDSFRLLVVLTHTLPTRTQVAVDESYTGLPVLSFGGKAKGPESVVGGERKVATENPLPLFR